MSEKIKLVQNYFMEPHRIKTLKEIIGKQLNHEQHFQQKLAIFVAIHMVILKTLVLQECL